jgi:hypothetical protein
MFRYLLTAAVICLSFGAVVRAAELVRPEAAVAVASTNYCFARPHPILEERLPPSSLVMRLNVQVAYRNPGPRPLILPLEHDRVVYTALAPGVMKKLGGSTSLYESGVKAMKELPDAVSADSPLDPPNDVFGIIPPSSERKLAALEEITVPVYIKYGRAKTDLRGRRIYVRLQLDHQELEPGFEAALSDRWTRFGVPWTGMLRTNTLVIDVPAAPPATGLCTETKPAHSKNRVWDPVTLGK